MGVWDTQGGLYIGLAGKGGLRNLGKRHHLRLPNHNNI
mgnify:CR=1 FL=1